MEHERDPTPQPHLPYLERLARELGDPDLFPPEVVQLYDEGKLRRARSVLRKHQRRTERDVARAELQRRVVEEPRHWLEPIPGAPTLGGLFGIGLALLGRHRPASDGTYIATQWFTALLPVWPLAAFLVRKERDGLTFLGRTSVPPLPIAVRWLSGAVAGVLLAWGAWSWYWAGTHADLYVYNGFDRGIVAYAGTEQQEVAARSYVVFDGLPLATTAIGASWKGDTARFESVTADLTGHAWDIVIYNVASRAVLGIGYIVYGEGTPPDSRLLDAGPVVVVKEKVDYAFVSPPDSLRMEGRGGFRKVLSAADTDVDPGTMVHMLQSEGRREQALAVARAELTVHPENADLAGYTALVLLADSFSAQVELLRSCLDRVPDSVEVHRAYQSLWDDPSAIRPEYAALLEANPESPMYHYLIGRLEPVTSDEALHWYQAALELDPAYPRAIAALGYRAMMLGEWAEAVAYLDRYAALGDAQAAEMLEERIRLRRLLERDPEESIQLVEAAAAQHAGELYYAGLAARLRVERDPERGSEECEALGSAARAQGVEGYEVVDLCANLAVTAGDLARARDLLGQVAEPWQRSVHTAMRLALSDGAVPDDRLLLTEIPNWQRQSTFYGVLALEFVDRSAWATLAVTWLQPDFEVTAELLSTPEHLVQPSRLEALLEETPLFTQAVVYFAAARRLAEEPGRDARRARQLYESRARSLALPGELPWMGR